jgi:hypothetical protein
LITTQKQRGGITGNGFLPGQSGNPGGRPKSMAAIILEQRPTASEDLVEFWTLVAFGSPAAIQKKYGVKPTMRDRFAAVAELADRLHGRPVQAMEFDAVEEVPCFILPEGTKVAIE